MNTTVEIIMQRETCDGVRVLFYNDALITNSLGYGFGAGTGRVKSQESLKLALQANNLVAGEICLYDLNEVQTLSQVARAYVKRCKQEKRSPSPGEYRTLVNCKLYNDQPAVD